MFGTIIVPLDGSQLAEKALAFAEPIAARIEKPILAVRVLNAGADESEVADAKAYLSRIESSVGGPVQTVIEQGRPADKISELAETVEVPLIVMSTHGRGGFRRLVTGSVAGEVVRTTGIPVLLVRAEMEIPKPLEISNILVPVDGSANAEVALDYALELARAFQSQIHLLRVVDTPSAYAMLSRHMEVVATENVLEEIISSMKREADEYLDQLANKISDEGVAVKTMRQEGYPGDQLLQHEQSGGYQLVVMATAGRSGVSRVVFGSVAERVLKLGQTPVMMIKPQDVSE